MVGSDIDALSNLFFWKHIISLFSTLPCSRFMSVQTEFEKIFHIQIQQLRYWKTSY